MPGMFKYLRRKSGAAGIIGVAKDVYWNLVSLLLRTKSSTQSTKFKDASASNNAITTVGDAKSSSFSPFSNVGFSAYFDGNGDCITPAFKTEHIVGSSDFTAEFWFNPSTVAKNCSIFGKSVGSNGVGPFSIGLSPAGNVQVLVSTDGSSWAGTINGPYVNAGTWYHYAVSRVGSIIYGFLNGALFGTYNIGGAALSANGNPLNIGNTSWGNFGVNGYNGYVSNLRFVVGTGLYSANFTPVTSKLTAITNTVFLCCQNGSFTDNSSLNCAITVYGNTSIQAFSPFAPATYVEATHGSSVYFDGTGDYLTIPASVDNQMSASNFSFEAWVYPTTSSGTRIIAGRNNSSISTSEWDVYLDASGYLKATAYQAGSQYDYYSTSVVPTNAWSHVAFTRNGNTFKLFLNGVQVAGQDNALTLNTTNVNLTIGGSVNGVNLFTGYLANINIVKGTAKYTSNFSIPTAPVVADENTKFLLKATSTALGGNDFFDNSNYKRTVTGYGDVRQGSFGPFAGSSSAYFDGSGDYLLPASSSDFAFGTGDYTIEMWVYVSSQIDGCIFGTDNLFNLFLENTGRIYFDSASGQRINTTTGVMSVSVWTHLAFVRKGTTLNLYKDGVSVATGTNSTNLNNQVIYIGRNGGGGYFTGYITNLNVIKGTAKYTSNFAVPTALTTAHANTKMLLNFDNSGEVDASNNVPLKLVNGATVTTTVAKFNSSINLTPAGSRVTNPFTHQGLNFGTGDFTIEGWFYFSSAVSRPYGIACWQMSSTVGGVGGPYYTGIYNNNNAALELAYNGTGISTGFTPAMNTWYHIAMSRCNGVTKLFIDGLQKVSVADPANYLGTYFSLGVYSQDGYNLGGYVEDFRITKGVARYVSEFTPPSVSFDSQTGTIAGDPYYNNVVLLAHMEGTNNSTKFADQKGHTFTVNGGVLSTTQKKFGNTCMYGQGGGVTFAASSDWVLPGDFTIECWAYRVDNGGSDPLFSSSPVGSGLYIRLYTGTGVGWGINGTQAAGWVPETPILNGWVHWAMVRSGSKVTLYANGVAKNSLTFSGTVNPSGQAFKIGSLDEDGSQFNGYIDEFRLTKGVARYTSNFSVPTAAFPDYQDHATDPYLNNTILLKANSTAVRAKHTIIEDSSTSTNTRGFNNGTHTVVQTKGTGPSANLNSYVVGSSQANCSLSTTDFNFGTGDFTIEFWLKGPLSSNQHIFYYGVAGGNGASDGAFILGTSGYQSTAGYLRYCGSQRLYSGTTLITDGTWHHCAVVRQNQVATIYVDGVARGSGADTSNMICNTAIGIFGDHGGSQGLLNTSYSNFRVVKGTAVYTSDFSNALPYAPLTAIPGTQLLLLANNAVALDSNYTNNNAIVDSSANNYQITRFGNVAQGTFSPFESNYDATKHSWDFSAGGKYASVNSNAAFALNTGDFTVEMWMYWNTDSLVNDAIFYMVGDPNTDQLSLWRKTGDGRFDVWVRGYSKITGIIPNCAGKWQHLAVTRQSGTMRLFLNGVLASSIANSHDHQGGTFQMGAIYWAPNNNIDGKLSNLRVVKGTALYTSNFIPSRKPLTAIPGTLVLCCQDNTFKDNSSNNWTINTTGTPTISTANPHPVVPYTAVTHGGSAYFDGSGDYFTLENSDDWKFGTGDYTVEFWMNPTVWGSSTNFGIIGQKTGDGAAGWQIHHSGAQPGKLEARMTAGGPALFSTNVISANCWTHVAVVRQGNTLYLYLNGVLNGTQAYTENVTGSTAKLQIGRAQTWNADYQGYLADLHVIKGTAKYTSTFTPPTAPIVADANTKLLLPFTNAAIVDATGKICIETSSNNGAVVSTANKKFATSMQFNGVDGTYMRLGNSQMFNFGVADYTIEFWYYKPTTQSNYPCLFYTRWPDMGGISLMDQSNVLTMYAGGGWGIANNFNCGTLQVGAWTHIAVTRTSGITRVFLNGNQSATHSNSADMGWVEGDKPCIGGLYDSTRPLNGCIEDFRITNGVSRYQTNFTVPLKELPTT